MESEDEHSTSKKNKHIENKQTNDKSEKLKKNFIQGGNNNETGDVKNQEYLEEDEFNPSLAAMEQEIKPQVISTINFICKWYNRFRRGFFIHSSKSVIISGFSTRIMGASRFFSRTGYPCRFHCKIN